MGVLRYSMWIDASPIAIWNVFTNLDRLLGPADRAHRSLRHQ